MNEGGFPPNYLPVHPRKFVGEILSSDRSTVESTYFPRIFMIDNPMPHWKIEPFMQHSKPILHTYLAHALTKHPSIEYNVILYVTLSHNTNHLVGSKFIAVESLSEIDDTIDVVTELIVQTTAESHKILDLVLKLLLNIRKLPLRVGSYIPWPTEFAKVGTNVRSDDNFCFKWAILSAVIKHKGDNEHLKNPESYEEPSAYGIKDIASDRIKHLDFSGLKFPHEVRNCWIFEQRNPQVSVNVFGYEKLYGKHSTIIGPLYRTRREKHIHLNLVYMEERWTRDYLCTHYAHIDELASVIRGCKEKYICNTCLHAFRLKNAFDKHRSDRSNCRDFITF